MVGWDNGQIFLILKSINKGAEIASCEWGMYRRYSFHSTAAFEPVQPVL